MNEQNKKSFPWPDSTAKFKEMEGQVSLFIEINKILVDQLSAVFVHYRDLGDGDSLLLYASMLQCLVNDILRLSAVVKETNPEVLN